MVQSIILTNGYRWWSLTKHSVTSDSRHPKHILRCLSVMMCHQPSTQWPSKRLSVFGQRLSLFGHLFSERRLFVYSFILNVTSTANCRHSIYLRHVDWSMVLCWMLTKWQICSILHKLFFDKSGELLCCLVFTHRTLPPPQLPPTSWNFGLWLVCKTVHKLDSPRDEIEKREVCTPPPESSSCGSCLACHW